MFLSLSKSCLKPGYRSFKRGRGELENDNWDRRKGGDSHFIEEWSKVRMSSDTLTIVSGL